MGSGFVSDEKIGITLLKRDLCVNNTKFFLLYNRIWFSRQSIFHFWMERFPKLMMKFKMLKIVGVFFTHCDFHPTKLYKLFISEKTKKKHTFLKSSDKAALILTFIITFLFYFFSVKYSEIYFEKQLHNHSRHLFVI